MLFKQTHTELQRAFDAGQGWRQQLSDGLVLFEKPQKLSGDMTQRGFWYGFEGMWYCPYAQISCAVGQASDVHTESHLKKIIELTKQYGKTFIFTAVNEPLKELVKLHAEHFIPLMTQESWMNGRRDVWLVGSKT